MTKARKVDNPFQELVKSIDELKEDLVVFAKTEGEQQRNSMLTREPMLHHVLSKTPEDAEEMNLFTDEGASKTREMALKDQRFKEWFTH